MVRGLATKPTKIGSDKVYLIKAREFLEGARILTENGKWNSSAVLSVHAVISACDAVCSRFIQLRHGGADHMQAVALLKSLPFEKDEIDSKLKQAGRVISLKNAAEYMDELIDRKDAEEMLRDAERIVEWAKSKMGV
jgi:HEPN domain-containing protein